MDKELKDRILKLQPTRHVPVDVKAIVNVEEGAPDLLEEMFPTLVPTESEPPDTAQLGDKFIAAARIIQQVQASELRIADLVESLE